MKFVRPSVTNNLSEIDGTVIIPVEDIEIPLEDIKTLTRQVSDKQAHKDEIELFRDGTDGDYLELDLETLLILCWEHQQYSAARGFSVSHLDVLRAVETLHNERVLTSEIMESPWTNEYSKPTIQAALRTLVDRGLINKQGRGVYSYVGPMGLPNSDEE